MDLEYNWLASLITLLATLAIGGIGRAIFFRIPALQRAREHDLSENRRKRTAKPERYQGRLKSTTKISTITNIVFFVAVLPFLVTLESQSVDTVLLHVVLILMTYDLAYYLTHRFLFHGKGYLRQVHAVHHQARTRVSSVDSYLLHPWEAIIGIALFFVTAAVIGLVLQSPFHVATIVITMLVYTQLNQINHCRIDLEGFPWKTLNWIARSHDAHHINMHTVSYTHLTLPTIYSV